MFISIAHNARFFELYFSQFMIIMPQKLWFCQNKLSSDLFRIDIIKIENN